MSPLREPVSVIALACVAFIATEVGHAQEAPSASEVLELAAKRHASANAVCADFDHHLEIVLLREEKSGHGRLCSQRPNLFAMRFSEPDGDAVIVDGTWTWIYYPSNDRGQVLRLAASARGGAHDIFREFLEDPASMYEATYLATEEPGEGIRAHRIRLVPRREARFVGAELWIDARDHLLHRLRIEDENGTIRTITLSGTEIDPDGLDESWFEFEPPPGAMVITR